MAFTLIWSPAARRDLQELLSYIGEHDPVAAERFGCGVLNAVERLVRFPESGRTVPEFGDPAIRELIRRPCRIVYRLDTGKRLVELARIWHAARGIPEL